MIDTVEQWIIEKYGNIDGFELLQHNRYFRLNHCNTTVVAFEFELRSSYDLAVRVFANNPNNIFINFCDPLFFERVSEICDDRITDIRTRFMRRY